MKREKAKCIATPSINSWVQRSYTVFGGSRRQAAFFEMKNRWLFYCQSTSERDGYEFEESQDKGRSTYRAREGSGTNET